MPQNLREMLTDMRRWYLEALGRFSHHGWILNEKHLQCKWQRRTYNVDGTGWRQGCVRGCGVKLDHSPCSRSCHNKIPSRTCRKVPRFSQETTSAGLFVRTKHRADLSQHRALFTQLPAAHWGILQVLRCSELLQAQFFEDLRGKSQDHGACGWDMLHSTGLCS